MSEAASSTSAGGAGGGSGGLRPYESRQEVKRSDLIKIMQVLDYYQAREVAVPENLVRAAVAATAKLLGSTNERNVARAVECVERLLTYNLRRFEVADKIARLDGGDPTERVEHQGGVEIDLMGLAARDPAVMRTLMDAIKANGLPSPDGEDERS